MCVDYRVGLKIYIYIYIGVFRASEKGDLCSEEGDLCCFVGMVGFD